jgi:hypothetical protein
MSFQDTTALYELLSIHISTLAFLRLRRLLMTCRSVFISSSYDTHYSLHFLAAARYLLVDFDVGTHDDQLHFFARKLSTFLNISFLLTCTRKGDDGRGGYSNGSRHMLGRMVEMCAHAPVERARRTNAFAKSVLPVGSRMKATHPYSL